MSPEGPIQNEEEIWETVGGELKNKTLIIKNYLQYASQFSESQTISEPCFGSLVEIEK